MLEACITQFHQAALNVCLIRQNMPHLQLELSLLELQQGLLNAYGRQQHKVARSLLPCDVQHVLSGLVVNQPRVLLPPYIMTYVNLINAINRSTKG